MLAMHVFQLTGKVLEKTDLPTGYFRALFVRLLYNPKPRGMGLTL
jgi:hypothetical protein